MKLPFIGKKEEKAPSRAVGARNPASSRVGALSSQGMSEPEIIRKLRGEGYSPMEVDSAMKTALRSAASGSPQQMRPPGYDQGPPVSQQYAQQPQYDNNMPPAPTDDDRRRIFPEENMPPEQDDQLSYPGEPMEQRNPAGLPELPGYPSSPQIGDEMFDQPLPATVPGDDFSVPGINDPFPPIRGPRAKPQASRIDQRRETEELIETIIEEKSDTFRREVDKVEDEIKKLEGKIHILEERFHRFVGNKKSEADVIKQSISEYGDSIDGISARMGSVERALKDSMGPMMQTMRSLSGAIDNMKKSK